MKKAKREWQRECWLCGRNGQTDPLDKHHIFGGANRTKSEQYGAWVYLCHSRCHENGPESVHKNAATAQRLHEFGQQLLMEENGWTAEDFRLEFGRNYLDDTEYTVYSDKGIKLGCSPIMEQAVSAAKGYAAQSGGYAEVERLRNGEKRRVRYHADGRVDKLWKAATA